MSESLLEKELEIVCDYIKSLKACSVCYKFFLYNTDEEYEWIVNIKKKYNLSNLIIEPNLITTEKTLKFIELNRNLVNNEYVIAKANEDYMLFSQITRELNYKYYFCRQNIMFVDDTYYLYTSSKPNPYTDYHQYSMKITIPELDKLGNDSLVFAMSEANRQSLLLTNYEMLCLMSYLKGDKVFVVSKDYIEGVREKFNKLFAISKSFFVLSSKKWCGLF